MKKILILLIALFFAYDVNALCDYKYIAEIKAFSSNITTTYTYKIVNREALFDVTLSNIPDDVYILDGVTGEEYRSFTNRELTIRNYSGDGVSYDVYSSKCNYEYLTTVYVSFPKYNIYSEDQMCEGIEDFKYCNRWNGEIYSYESFVDEILKYKEKKTESTKVEKVGIIDKIVSFYLDNYQNALITVGILAGLLFLYLKRKNSVDLKI